MKFRSMGADAQMVLDDRSKAKTQNQKKVRDMPQCLQINKKSDDWSCPKCRKGEKNFCFSCF